MGPRPHNLITHQLSFQYQFLGSLSSAVVTISVAIIFQSVWALVFGFGSYYSGNALIKAAGVVGDKPWIAPIILVVFGGALWLYMHKATKKKVKYI